MSDMPNESSPAHARTEKSSRGKWQLGLVVTVTALTALILIAYGAAGSYQSLAQLAAAHSMPLPRLFPVGLDGGLVGVIVIDIGLTWIGTPVGWLRQTARLFALASVAANVLAGLPDRVSAGLHAIAPVLIIVIAEVVRAVLLRRNSGYADPVPVSRWLLDFRGTFRLWRRMKLWRVRSYAAAIDMEIARQQAIQKLADRYGDGWRAAAPGVLVWMLTAGVRMDEALAMVAELCAPPKPEVQSVRSGVNRSRASGGKGKSKSALNRRTPSVPLDPEMEGLSGEAQVWMLMQREPGISGPEIGRRLGLSESYACRMKKKLSDAAPATGPIDRVAS